MLPEIYLNSLKSLLNDEEYILILNEYKNEYHSGMRINTLKIEKDEFLSKYNFSGNNIEWCSNGFYFDNNSRISKTPMYNAGLFYIQEPSAMFPVEALDVKPNMRVLDLCAAPGGKSVQIATKLKNTGVLISNDISLKRTKAILKNFEQHGIQNAIITNSTPDELSSKFTNYFDRILVDAPCSGEGMFRKDKSLIKSYEKCLHEVVDTQKEILYYAQKMLKKDGILVYSTCTFNKSENENIIIDFLSKNRNFIPIDFFKNKKIYDGFVIDDYLKSIRLFPHKVRGEGHFISVLKKTDDSSHLENDYNFFKKDNIDKSKIDILKKYLEENTNIVLDYSKIKINLNSAYMEIIDSELLKPIRIIRNGLYLGDFERGTFKPSSAFIMAFNKDNFKFTISYNNDDEDLYRYLKCETIHTNKADGTYVVCLDKFPLGLLKVKNNVGKNLYNQNWRIQ